MMFNAIFCIIHLKTEPKHFRHTLTITLFLFFYKLQFNSFALISANWIRSLVNFCNLWSIPITRTKHHQHSVLRTEKNKFGQNNYNNRNYMV